LIRSPVNWTRALIVGGVVSLTYTSIVVAYSLFPFSNVDISEPVWQTAGSLTLLSLGVIGAPIALWLRYRLRSPLAFLGGILLFWHVLVEFPPIGSGQGDSPGFLFVFALSPLYVAAYGILAGTEYWVRQNRFPTLS
jgi:hypothetical protein